MASINKAIVIGNLGVAPEIRYTQSGSAVCNLRVATHERWTGKDGEPGERTEWHNIVVFGKQAENCEKYLEKGRQVYVEGRLQTRKWEDRDGNDRYTTEIVAQEMQMLDSRNMGGDAGGYQSAPAASPSTPAATDPAPIDFPEDDIPF